MGRFLAITLVAAIAGAALGWGIFNYALGGTPKIAVMDGPLILTDFDEGVIEFELAKIIATKVEFVARDPDIKAVVIRINSPGGEATSSERLYHELAQLRESKPVVISAQWLLASGGYMMSMGANHIVASPTSNVGSIGVVGTVLPPLSPSEFQIGTGPQKTLGASQRATLRELELAKEVFYTIVVSERGDRLTIDKSHLLSGGTYLGIEALTMGLIDELGGEQDAIERAAELAGLRRYDVIQVEEEMEKAGGRFAEAVATVRERPAELDLILGLREAARQAQTGRVVAPDLGTPDLGTDEAIDASESDEQESSEGPAPGRPAFPIPPFNPVPSLYYLYLPP